MTTEATQETPATDTPAPSPADVKAPPTLTQEQVNSIVQSRIDAARKAWRKTTPETGSDCGAEGGGPGSTHRESRGSCRGSDRCPRCCWLHDPETVAKLVDLDGLGATDGPAIATRVASIWRRIRIW